MIIPIRCVTCGKLLANKEHAYQRMCEEVEEKAKKAKKEGVVEADEVKFKNFQDGYKGKILDELGLDRPCCRRHMLGTVNIGEVPRST